MTKIKETLATLPVEAGINLFDAFEYEGWNCRGKWLETTIDRAREALREWLTPYLKGRGMAEATFRLQWENGRDTLYLKDYFLTTGEWCKSSEEEEKINVPKGTLETCLEFLSQYDYHWDENRFSVENLECAPDMGALFLCASHVGVRELDSREGYSRFLEPGVEKALTLYDKGQGYLPITGMTYRKGEDGVTFFLRLPLPFYLPFMNGEWDNECETTEDGKKVLHL